MSDHAELELKPMTEAKVTELLQQKHAGDIAIPQCKTGSSWTGPAGSTGVIDVWACPYSFTRPVIAYEIKVSRADFLRDLRDEKWRQYLPFCDRFYFVTPWGMVERAEVPAPAGLYYVSRDQRVVQRRRAGTAHATGEPIPSSIFRYALLWRVEDAAERLERLDELREAL